MLVNKKIEQLVRISGDVNFGLILTKYGYRDKLYSKYCNLINDMLWENIAQEAQVKNIANTREELIID